MGIASVYFGLGLCLLVWYVLIRSCLFVFVKVVWCSLFFVRGVVADGF